MIADIKSHIDAIGTIRLQNCDGKLPARRVSEFGNGYPAWNHSVFLGSETFGCLLNANSESQPIPWSLFILVRFATQDELRTMDFDPPSRRDVLVV